jgi:hypothetical protein
MTMFETWNERTTTSPALNIKCLIFIRQNRQLLFRVQPVISDRYDQRDYKGWPLLTVENEALGLGTQRVQMKGSFLGWFFRPFLPAQEIFSCLGCCSRPSTNIFFLTIHYFNSFVPIAQQAG